ncbi:hypothetical protein WSM22_16500 [Cytophagales bacterium WSM2-2]|nr:hypothetical protein WSM22_16500 [Cytophagales bacterium WSM2-2]
MATLNFSKEERDKFFQIIYEKSDRIMSYAIWIYLAFGLFLASFYNTFTIAIGVGGLCAAAYFLTKSLLPKSNAYQYVLSAVLAVFSAQFIYQMHGLFEMHFMFFVGATLLVTYRNWKLIIPLLLLTVIHHASFAWLQYKGMKEIYFTQLDYMDLQAFIFHALLAAVIMGICGYWSYDLERTSVSDADKTISLEKQMKSVSKNIAFANEISKGNLNAEYNLIDEHDELGNSLLTMQQNLKTSNSREQEEKFITVGITKVGDIIQKHGNDPEALADEFIKCIVKYTNLNQGGLFLAEKENEKSYLKLVACYAYDRKKFLNKRIEPGEGLVGQCFLEKEPTYIKVVPDDYIKITSGLGEAPPRSVYLQPLQTTEEIIGVMELASFHELRDFEKQFIQRAAENISSAIISSRTTHRITLLLADSQQRAEEMRAQEEEMRQNMEELQATQEEISRKQVENENRIRAINESGVASIEFSMDGIIQDANEAFLNLMGYSLSEIKDKHHRIFVSNEYAASDEYKKFWQDLRNGIPRPGEYQRVTKSGQKVFIKGSYSIINDNNGRPVKVLKLASDITTLKSQQEEMKMKQVENENRINAVNESGIASIEFAMDGTIQHANEAFLSLMGYSLDEIKGKHHRIFVDKDYAKSEEYKKFWQDLANGIPRPGEYKRIKKSGKRVFIKGSYSILLDQHGKPIRVLKLAIDIMGVINNLKFLDQSGNEQMKLIDEDQWNQWLHMN